MPLDSASPGYANAAVPAEIPAKVAVKTIAESVLENCLIRSRSDKNDIWNLADTSGSIESNKSAKQLCV
jgi:hypothetical protein